MHRDIAHKANIPLLLGRWRRPSHLCGEHALNLDVLDRHPACQVEITAELKRGVSDSRSMAKERGGLSVERKGQCCMEVADYRNSIPVRRGLWAGVNVYRTIALHVDRRRRPQNGELRVHTVRDVER